MNMTFIHDEKESGTSRPSNNSISIVLARIQERANQLSSERATHELLCAEQEDAKKILEEKRHDNLALKRKLLASIRDRTEIELSYFRHQDAIRDYKNDLANIESSTKILNEEIETIQQRAKNVTETIYSKHVIETETFQRQFSSHVEKLQERKRKRERQLDDLALQTEMYREEATAMHQERTQLRDDIQRMEEQETKEDEEITNNAIAIRDMITKVILYYNNFYSDDRPHWNLTFYKVSFHESFVIYREQSCAYFYLTKKKK